MGEVIKVDFKKIGECPECGSDVCTKDCGGSGPNLSDHIKWFEDLLESDSDNISGWSFLLISFGLVAASFLDSSD